MNFKELVRLDGYKTIQLLRMGVPVETVERGLSQETAQALLDAEKHQYAQLGFEKYYGRAPASELQILTLKTFGLDGLEQATNGECRALLMTVYDALDVPIFVNALGAYNKARLAWKSEPYQRLTDGQRESYCAKLENATAKNAKSESVPGDFFDLTLPETAPPRGERTFLAGLLRFQNS